MNRMPSDRLSTRALVVGLTWPNATSGPGIAIGTSLRYYTSFFDHVLYIGCSEEMPPERTSFGDSVSFARVTVRRAPRLVRFLRSLGSLHPGTIMHLAGPSVSRRLTEEITGFRRKHGPIHAIIFEGLTAAYFLPLLRRRVPEARFALRSFDVTSAAFAGFCRLGPIWSRLAWSLEVAKLRRFEKRVFQRIDRAWAISEADMLDYRRLCGLSCHGVLGAEVDVERFRGIEAGDSQTLISLGSVDYRKAQGMKRFVSDVWPRIRAQYRASQFVLAGRGTEIFADPGKGIEGLGFVYDDSQVWNRGALFLNAQEQGSGLKLKSLTAMAAGKLLISTAHGVRGIECAHGRECFVGNDDVHSLETLICQAFDNPKEASRIAQRGRAFVQERFGPGALREPAREVLDSLMRVIGQRPCAVALEAEAPKQE